MRNENIYISAREPDSIEFLTDVILEKLEADYVVETLTIPYERGDILSYLMENGTVEILRYGEEGTIVRTHCSPQVTERAVKMLVRGG